MSDIIKLLPDSVANQIAAGEVVKRPASVIKELVENSADAGATRIDIVIKDGGRTLIQVVDNGKGMSPTDARMAFERHATSKITTAADLYKLHTMGFRGEALPSICAISQVELRTRPSEDQIGTRLLINGSRVESQKPDMCEAGTNIMVRNLFYNVPARRKFMSSDSVETSHILREFERLALVNNDLQMSIDTGNRRIELRPGNFKQRITDLWRNNLNMKLVKVDVETSMVKIHGYVSRPEYARRRNPLQFMIANGRNMYHKKFHTAILTAYNSLIANDTQPCYFLKIDVDPETVDVNIHPTKHTIKFENEDEIWSILHTAVRSSLGMNAAVPSIDFESDALPVDSHPDLSAAFRPDISVDKDYNPFKQQDVSRKQHDSAGYNPFSKQSKTPSNWEMLYDKFMGDKKGESSSVTQRGMPQNREFEFEITTEPNRDNAVLPELESQDDIAPRCFQYAQKYIITCGREELLIIDQYRAHVRILFEQYMQKMTYEEQVSQGIMFPETIELDETQLAVMRDMEWELKRLGFIFEHDADDEAKVRVTSVPAMLRKGDIADVVYGILDSVHDKSSTVGVAAVDDNGMKRRMALIMARSGAIPRGQRLSADEMEHIISELFALPDPAFTPEGNPVYTKFDVSQLDSFFR